jgi:alkane 1-monooxygenase
MGPHHSWNATHRVSNWLLINLQRHADHHVKPDRRYPLLQTYEDDVAPHLPHGYPLMTIAAMIPPVWKRIMNPRVKRGAHGTIPRSRIGTPTTRR